MAEGRLRVGFLTYFFPPEVGAAQARMFELAKRLHDGGDQVTVITAFPNYPTGAVQEGYRGRFAMEERIEGVRVLRRWVFATPNAGFFKRILSWLSFVATSITAWRQAGTVDVMFAQTPPLPMGIAALILSRLWRAPMALNVSDIWPESAVQLGMLRNRTAIRMAEMFEMHLYRRAARITVPTPGMLERLSSRGVPREKLVWLTNGVDTSTYRPRPRNAELAGRLGLDARKIFLYAGTHGLSQGLDTLLDAAKLTTDPDILYVLVGDGADKAALVARAARENLANVRFLPSQPRAVMPDLLNLAYAGVICLRPLELFRAAIPSKMFESMAVAQPLIASVWGEAADLVSTVGCGLVSAPGDAPQLAEAAQALARDPAGAREMGLRGRAYVEQHYDRAATAALLRDVLSQVAAKVSLVSKPAS